MEDHGNTVEISENECRVLNAGTFDDKLIVSVVKEESVPYVDAQVENKDINDSNNDTNDISANKKNVAVESEHPKCDVVDGNVGTKCGFTDGLITTSSFDSDDMVKNNPSYSDIVDECSDTTDLDRSTLMKTDVTSSLDSSDKVKNNISNSDTADECADTTALGRSIPMQTDVTSSFDSGDKVINNPSNSDIADECSDASELYHSVTIQTDITSSFDKIKDNPSHSNIADKCSNGTDLCHSIAVQTNVGSCAFTKFQDSDSCTEDSESDSSSSESETESSSVDGDDSEQSDSSIEETTLQSPSKARTEDGVRKSKCDSQKKKYGIKYKNELDIEDLPPIEDLHITVLEDECEPLGTVYSIVNQLVVIQSLPNRPALNLDSLLFKKDGHCLGQIFDVFGPVKTPFYTLRFNSRQDVVDKGIEKGQTVYCAPQTPHTKYVFIYQLMQQKGSDASWKHNYEVPDALKDYSDDEEERKAKRKHYQKTRGRPDMKADDCTVPLKHIKKEFFHDYNNYTGNEWYKSRVIELNQFNRLNKSQHCYKFQNSSSFNRTPNNGDTNPNQNNSYPVSTRYVKPPQGIPMIQPVLRPSTPNNWHASSSLSNSNANAQQSVSFSNVDRAVSTWVQQPPLFSCPPPPLFSRPPPPLPHPPFSGEYDRLNSTAHFNNPVSPFSSRVAHPPPQWMQTQTVNRNVPFRNDNTRRTDLVPPRPLPSVPPLPRPNLIHRPVTQINTVSPPPYLFNRPPPGPPPTF